MLTKSDLVVELGVPFTFARERGTLESSCLRISCISLLRPARDTVRRRCNNFLSALITFFSFCMLIEEAYNVANVFDLFFYWIKKRHILPYQPFTYVL